MSYEKLIEKSEECCLKAVEFFKNGDLNMSKFWKNASDAFKKKARELKIS